jgi:hypothetical protein
MRHAGFARNFESTLRLLAERGHEVHVCFDGPFLHAGDAARPGIVERLAEEQPAVSFGPAPDRAGEPWFALGLRLRLGVDYLRFLAPAYAGAPKLRARVEERVGPLMRVAGRAAARRSGGPARLGRMLRALDASLPTSPGARELVRREGPDVLLVTPLVELGEPQTDFVRAAKALGVPTALCVASWDNLTNKGSIPEIPELVTVWNDAQRREAVALHGVPAERVVATGAQPYDQWFAWAPSSDRASFAARVGLPGEGPLVLYLCSSEFIAPDEAAFVRRWLGRLRARPEPELCAAEVLVRPHPQNAGQWRDPELDGLGPVAVWPHAGADPVDADSRRDYFDSIHFSSAVVGVNTSALIESAIVGRPVLTQLAPEFRETQGGTLHFAHLVEGGPLRVAKSFDEHAAQLVEALTASRGGLGAGGGTATASGPGDAAEGFLRSFVRPHGLDQPATPRLVAAVEALAGTTPEAPRRPLGAPALRVALTPLAALAWLDAAARRGARGALGRALATRPGALAARRWLVPLANPAEGSRPAPGMVRGLVLEARRVLASADPK